jgi:ABC-type antimicrobial peptide transport system permease subunit
VVPAVRRTVRQVDPAAALVSAAPFERFLEGPLGQPRLNALLLAVFAVAAVTLAAVGLFGIMATAVRRRTRELGVRLALGATAGDLRRMVMRRGLAIAAAGSALGLVGAILANRLLTSMLYDVHPTDGVTLLAVTVLLLAVSALASFVPARATTRVDPVAALRSDG